MLPKRVKIVSCRLQPLSQIVQSANIRRIAEPAVCTMFYIISGARSPVTPPTKSRADKYRLNHRTDRCCNIWSGVRIETQITKQWSQNVFISYQGLSGWSRQPNSFRSRCSRFQNWYLSEIGTQGNCVSFDTFKWLHALIAKMLESLIKLQNKPQH